MIGDKSPAMKCQSRPGGLALGAGLLAGLAIVLSGCMADEPVRQVAAAANAQPRLATYDCGEDGTISVESMASAVRLTDADGGSYDLPASPPAQSSRFGEGNLALVVEDREALWMKAGSEPMTCRR